MRQYYKSLLTSFIIVTLLIVSGLLLLGTYDATQADTFNCERIRSECVPRGPKPICPNPNPKRIGSECVPHGERPICPNIDLTPRCPLDAAKERRN